VLLEIFRCACAHCGQQIYHGSPMMFSFRKKLKCAVHPAQFRLPTEHLNTPFRRKLLQVSKHIPQAVFSDEVFFISVRYKARPLIHLILFDRWRLMSAFDALCMFQ
jgi:hypothetical protein